MQHDSIQNKYVLLFIVPV